MLLQKCINLIKLLTIRLPISDNMLKEINQNLILVCNYLPNYHVSYI